MAGALMGHAAAALRRRFLLAGVLAIVAGFLGMHIMTGMHGTHAMPAVTPSSESAVASSPTANGHTSHPAAQAGHARLATHGSMPSPSAIPPGPALAGERRAAASPASCVCQSSCADLASMHSACVPSAAAASLAAPPPGKAPASIHNPATPGDGAAQTYSYLPASPSPGDLSISRT